MLPDLGTRCARWIGKRHSCQGFGRRLSILACGAERGESLLSGEIELAFRGDEGASGDANCTGRRSW